MRISDWSSDVCSSDLAGFRRAALPCGDEGIVAGEQGVEEERDRAAARTRYVDRAGGARQPKRIDDQSGMRAVGERGRGRSEADAPRRHLDKRTARLGRAGEGVLVPAADRAVARLADARTEGAESSEAHTSELHSLMRHSTA